MGVRIGKTGVWFKGMLRYKQKLCFLMYIIIFRPQLQMHKNINKLVAQIKRSSSATRKESFKITSKNANHYANKIPVEEDAFNQPSLAENYVREEMNFYQNGYSNQNVANLNGNVKKKAEKPKGIEHQLNLLERNYNMQALQDLIASIRAANKEEMMRVRDKLTKLQHSLYFSLENEDLAPHEEEFLNDFLQELTRIINKPYQIY